jgi:CheY-like chemotaxis protein
MLIVEDESVTALDVARELHCLGYQFVAGARSGPQAVAHALTHRPDLVLMDIQLQRAIDGIEAARRI